MQVCPRHAVFRLSAPDLVSKDDNNINGRKIHIAKNTLFASCFLKVMNAENNKGKYISSFILILMEFK